MRKVGHGMILAAGVRAFFGAILKSDGPPTRPETPKLPNVYWDDDLGSLYVVASADVSINFSPELADRIASVVAHRRGWYHLGSTDHDVP
jgi:hypothetical protein